MKNNLSSMGTFILLIAIVLTTASCVLVEEHNSYLLSDPDMQLKSRYPLTYELDSHSYRESGAAIRGSHPGGGGCGCY